MNVAKALLQCAVTAEPALTRLVPLFVIANLDGLAILAHRVSNVSVLKVLHFRSIM